MSKIAGELVFVLKSLYLLLPGLFANMAPVVFSRVKFLDYPVDFGMRWRGKPLFGSNKTFRGFFFGILASIFLVYIQKNLFIKLGYFKGISFISYTEYNFVLLGFLMGFGVLLGDLGESFFKRQAGISPGKRWIPWDQLDCVIGGLAVVALVYIPPLEVIIFLLVAVPLLHIITNHIGYYLKVNKSRW